MELIELGREWLGMVRRCKAGQGNARQGNTLVNLLITLAEASQGTALLG